MSATPVAAAPAAPVATQVPSAKQNSLNEVPKAAQPPEPPNFKGTKHKVKMEGQESEVDYDELVRGYQKAQVADRRLQEASRKASEAEKVTKALEAGDAKWLVEKMGPQKARAMMESYLIEQLQFENLPPHEKALIEERKKRETLEQQIERQKQESEQARYQQVSEQAFRELDQEMSEALSAVGKTPNPRLALRMLDQIEARMKAKEERLPAKDAWEHAKRGLKEDISLIAPDLTPADVLDLFGQEFIDKLMNHKVSQVLDAKGKPRPKAAPQSRGPDKPMSIEDKFKEIEQSFSKRR